MLTLASVPSDKRDANFRIARSLRLWRCSRQKTANAPARLYRKEVITTWHARLVGNINLLVSVSSER